MRCSLKHEMFEIVCESCCLGRIVSATCAYGDISLYAWFFFVYGEIHLQSVVEGVEP